MSTALGGVTLSTICSPQSIVTSSTTSFSASSALSVA
jgi:hypothetical protein